MFLIIGELSCLSLLWILKFIICRRPNIYFNITSPTPGTFIIALHYKGREKAILEMDLKIDDLLEKVRLVFLEIQIILMFSSLAKGQQTSAGPRICPIECPQGSRTP